MRDVFNSGEVIIVSGDEVFTGDYRDVKLVLFDTGQDTYMVDYDPDDAIGSLIELASAKEYEDLDCDWHIPHGLIVLEEKALLMLRMVL